MLRKLKKEGFVNQTAKLIGSKKSFMVHTKRDVKVLYIDNHALFIQKNSNKSIIKDKNKKGEVINLMGNVSKNINKHIVNVNCNVEIIENSYPSTYSNRKLYGSLSEGEVFNYIDISHCFWRIAFLKKYISKNLYESILKKPHLKTYRNMALACIIAPANREYFRRGESFLKIEEEKSLHRILYDNIRFTAYNLMGEIKELIGEENCIGYRTDGVMVLPAYREMIFEYIKSKGYECTLDEVKKVDNYFYIYSDGTKKKF